MNKLKSLEVAIEFSDWLKKTDKLKVVEINENPEKHWPGSAGGGGIYGQTQDHGLRGWAFRLLVQVQLLRTGPWTIFLFSFPFPFYGLKLG
jgi:hypothetical protein